MILDFPISCSSAEYLEANVTPSNVESNAMVAGLARRWRSDCDSSMLFMLKFIRDGHEDEYRRRLGPLTFDRGE